MKKIESKYIEQHRKIFSSFPGSSLTPHISKIKNLIDLYKCRTLLDFGCGNAIEYLKNHVHTKVWQVPVTLYDPCHPIYNVLPNFKFDCVICTDVLEHIPEEATSDALDRIFSRALKFVYLNISIRPAVKKLPNNENAHVNIKTKDWWESKIKDANVRNISVFSTFEGGKQKEK